MAAEHLAREFTTYAHDKLLQHFAQVARCARLLSTDELWHRTNENTNSVANLLLHLNGNVRQWILTGIGGEPFDRDRPGEFSARRSQAAEELLGPLEQTVTGAAELVLRLSHEELLRPRTIQGYSVTGVVVIFHVVEHFAGHAGQIVHITKTLRNVDLSLYDAQGHRPPDAVQRP